VRPNTFSRASRLRDRAHSNFLHLDDFVHARHNVHGADVKDQSSDPFTVGSCTLWRA